MSVLSIQPWIVHGQAGGAAALACLQALGHEVWAVPTGIFSNPPGLGGATGRAVPAEQVAELIAGIVARGRLAECAAVISAAPGSIETGTVVLDAVERVKTANPRALHLCDPAIGEAGRVQAAPGLAEFVRDRAAGRADILVPNGFELSLLAGAAPGSLSEVAQAGAELRARLRPGGPRMVLAAGVDLAFLPQQTATLVVHEAGAAAVATPRLAAPPPGVKEAIAAIFLARLLDGAAPEAALSHAASAVQAAAEMAASRGTPDLPLVAARAALLDPPVLWPAEAVA